MWAVLYYSPASGLYERKCQSVPCHCEGWGSTGSHQQSGHQHLQLSSRNQTVALPPSRWALPRFPPRSVALFWVYLSPWWYFGGYFMTKHPSSLTRPSQILIKHDTFVQCDPTKVSTFWGQSKQRFQRHGPQIFRCSKIKLCCHQFSAPIISGTTVSIFTNFMSLEREFNEDSKLPFLNFFICLY